jgi:hypothetical protein
MPPQTRYAHRGEIDIAFAALVMAAADPTERRLGPSAAGSAAALPA